jgi:hypothetical protein
LALSKRQMMEVIPAFLRDKRRGISVALFAELCGLNPLHLRDVFLNGKYPLTELVQTRVNRAYEQWVRGDVAIMMKSGKKYLEFRKQPKPQMVKRRLITYDGSSFKLDLGIRPKSQDYQRPNLDQQLRKNHGSRS